MAVPPNAIVRTQWVSVYCPTCGFRLSPPGSLVVDFHIENLKANQTVKCETKLGGCGEVLKIPKKVEKLKGDI